MSHFRAEDDTEWPAVRRLVAYEVSSTNDIWEGRRDHTMNRDPVTVSVRRAFDEDISRIQSFYDRCGYRGGVRSSDEVLIAEQDDEIVGVVRIATECGTATLRGMQVIAHLRRKGIGVRLLTELDRLIGDRECFCLPYAELERFYGRIGFRRVADSVAPRFLQVRLATYRAKDPAMIMMRRNT